MGRQKMGDDFFCPRINPVHSLHRSNQNV
jgi:hypothetical protein